ncbi:MAG: hypothetical protein JW712_04655 [Dehalococcoidales bacterium]|nr:hypothetical protein [Dehalococcoidales bacterium]
MTINRKIAFIDLTSGKIESKVVPAEIRKKFIGGRGIDTLLLYNHLEPRMDALGPHNVLVIGAGILAGTPSAATSPLHICTKSPLNGYYCNYHGSNLFSTELRLAGYDHLVISGKSPNPVYIRIQNKKIEIKDASALNGKTVAETQQAIRTDLYDTNTMVMAIGPAGEKLVRFAGIFTGPDDKECGAGIGAVMGSKNLKAIACRGTLALNMTDARTALEYSYSLEAQVKSSGINTAQTEEEIPATVSDTSAGYEKLLTVLRETHLAAMNGLDPVETANMIAWAINLYKDNILTDEDTDGLNLSWDSMDDLLELVRKIAAREGLGDILAEGVAGATLKTGDDSTENLLQVKGRLVSPDTRFTPASALAVVTSASGTEYSKNRPDTDLNNLPENVLKEIYNQPFQYDGSLTTGNLEYEGKAWQTVWMENCCMSADILGIRDYHGIIEGTVYPGYVEWSILLFMATGLEMHPADIWMAGERAVTLERLFNNREGLTAEDDCLPEAYYERESIAPTPGEISIDKEKLTELVKEYYRYHGWDDNGNPGKEILTELAIDTDPVHRL